MICFNLCLCLMCGTEGTDRCFLSRWSLRVSQGFSCCPCCCSCCCSCSCHVDPLPPLQSLYIATCCKAAALLDLLLYIIATCCKAAALLDPLLVCNAHSLGAKEEAHRQGGHHGEDLLCCTEQHPVLASTRTLNQNHCLCRSSGEHPFITPFHCFVLACGKHGSTRGIFVHDASSRWGSAG